MFPYTPLPLMLQQCSVAVRRILDSISCKLVGSRESKMTVTVIVFVLAVFVLPVEAVNRQFHKRNFSRSLKLSRNMYSYPVFVHL